MGADAAKMPEAIKGAMLSCILSDTLEFRSPTTTDTDRDLAEALAAELGVDIPAYAAELFAAKSDVTAFSDAELLRMDSKEYEVGGVSFRVSVLETTSPETVLSRKDSLMASMPAVAEQDGVDQVPALRRRYPARAIDHADPQRADQTGGREKLPAHGLRGWGDADMVVFCRAVVSRKKQIIPNLAL